MNIPKPDDLTIEITKPAKKVLGDVPAAYDLDKSEYQYFLAKPEHSTSFVIKKSADGSEEQFAPASILGAGGFGRVRLFISKQDQSHVFAVKNVLHDNQIQSRALPFGVEGRVRASIREIEYLARVNPGLAPYLLKTFINDAGEFDNRMLMPYFPGQTLLDFVLGKVKTVAEFALLMLKIAQEVKRVHQLGLYHGDLRSGNFIINHAEQKEFGMRSFTVTIIDFDHGGEIGKRWQDSVEPGTLSDAEIMLFDCDEGYDVSSLRHWMNMSRSNTYIAIPDADQQIDKHFPAFRQFISPKFNKKYEPIQELDEFIIQMTANLETWDSRQRYEARLKNTSSTLFHERKRSVDEVDALAAEWEAKTIRL